MEADTELMAYLVESDAVGSSLQDGDAWYDDVGTGLESTRRVSRLLRLRSSTWFNPDFTC